MSFEEAFKSLVNWLESSYGRPLTEPETTHVSEILKNFEASNKDFSVLMDKVQNLKVIPRSK
ncbi:hypothetical protein QNH48_05975 [Neobacillus sp. YX16]|uniref:hypothetical protein n=1 Tax=Neobacillus sp. YX16 TaxID=3047874 RepID=UPI0024C27FC2|nr:hypothetical protein [Neobacillus sp. YX16]WHZ04200.1 hypothetical protein QNH48_05975 [Neobacillus sp. YX16]